MDTQWRHKSKISEKLGRCGRQNMLRPYLKIWEWEWIFGRAVKTVSSLGVRSPWLIPLYALVIWSNISNLTAEKYGCTRVFLVVPINMMWFLIHSIAYIYYEDSLEEKGKKSYLYLKSHPHHTSLLIWKLIFLSFLEYEKLPTSLWNLPIPLCLAKWKKK